MKEKIKQMKQERIFFMIIAIFFLILGLYYNIKADNLETENQQLRRQITIWTLKVYCIDNIEGVNMNILSSANFTDYEQYKEAKDLIKSEHKNCEVLE